MGKTYYTDWQEHAILLDNSEVAISSEDETSIAITPSDDNVILCVQAMVADCDDAASSGRLKIWFSEDGGAWTTPDGSTTAVRWGTSTTLVNGSSGSNAKCSTTPTNCGDDSFDIHTEVESLNYTALVAISADTWIEAWFALDFSNATPGSTYTFRLTNLTDGDTPLDGTITLSVLMTAAPIEASITAGLGAAETTGRDYIGDASITGALGASEDIPVQSTFNCDITAGIGAAFDNNNIFPGTLAGGVDLSVAPGGYFVRYAGTPGPAGFNPSDKDGSVTLYGTYNESMSSTLAYDSARSVSSKSSGKYYFEVVNYGNTGSPKGCAAGVATVSANISAICGSDANGWGFRITDGYGQLQTVHGNSFNDLGAATFVATTSVIMVAVDIDAGKIWFGHNGTWLGTGSPNPATGTAPALTDSDMTDNAPLFIMGSGRYSSGWGIDNTLVTAVADLNYTPPSGFSAWLSDPGEPEFHMDVVGGVGLADEVASASTVEASITADLGLAELIYTGDAAIYEVSIAGALGLGQTYSEAGSIYNAGIVGGLGADVSDGGEWDWEPTLFRYLDGRPGQVGLALGGFSKASVYGENYYKYFQHASRKYVLTISGGSGPIEVPMVGFQATLRDGDESALTVQIVGPYTDEIKARSGGSMSIEIVWSYGALELIRETLVSVSIESYTTSRTAGLENASIYGTGSRSYPGAKQVSVPDLVYENTQGGQVRFRAGYINEMEPGDTIVTDTREIIADIISYSVNMAGNSIQETIEVGEDH